MFFQQLSSPPKARTLDLDQDLKIIGSKSPGWVVPNDARWQRREDPGLGYWQETEALVAAYGQLLPLLGDVSHSLRVGATGLFLEATTVFHLSLTLSRRCLLDYTSRQASAVSPHKRSESGLDYSPACFRIMVDPSPSVSGKAALNSISQKTQGLAVATAPKPRC
ncbi:hypothetical protein J1605_014388 [Eschrichtius robustus]|uniref:Uncharacterized protein n=1 Tax=Eschrichtius robustus TaxID=9764 RepID=A0AB34GC84_ESCRO|nr:hypothetical protein J1605_014388 [Eschrichtius robustus]